MDLGINGKLAIVAAGTAGLGLASAKSLAANGAMVAICGRDPERLASAVMEVGHGCIGIRHDVSNQTQAREFVEEAIAKLGGVDILITNGGGPPPGNALETPIEMYSAALELSLLSVISMCQTALPYMRETGWGRIVAITSISVRQPIPAIALSNTARAGVTGYLKSLAGDVAPLGITVNTVQPGVHATGRIKQLYGTSLEVMANTIPVGFIGDPGDFGEAVAFLASHQARFITGASLNIDGGQFAGLQ
jgi:3-oxoacyl-[acyl-carrier protein] reductase